MPEKSRNYAKITFRGVTAGSLQSLPQLGISLTFCFIFLFFTACDIRPDTKLAHKTLEPGATPTIKPAVTPTMEPYVNVALFDDFLGTAVDETVWQIGTWSEHNGRTGKERCYVQDGNLHLVFINSSTNGFLSAAIQTRQEFLYGRWEARLQAANLPRICNAIYTIDWDNTTTPGNGADGTKQEIDIEFLTRSFSGAAGQVHFAAHHLNIPADSFQTNPDHSLGFNPAAGFHTWAIDITPERIQWSVDNQVLETYTYSGNPITIDAPYQLKLNTWSGINWVTGGTAPPANTEGHFLIDWIRFTPYSAGSSQEAGQ